VQGGIGIQTGGSSRELHGVELLEQEAVARVVEGQAIGLGTLEGK